MFKKTLKVLSLVAILSFCANANDLLADISKGAISDSSLGVKVLNTEEMNKVRGGYAVYTQTYGDSLAIVLAIPDKVNELGIIEGDVIASLEHSRGICPMGQTECYSNYSLQQHSMSNTQRLEEYKTALGGLSPYRFMLGYGVVNNKAVSSTGQVYNYFTPIILAIDYKTRDIHYPTVTETMLNTQIIREIRAKYQQDMQNSLGGLR